MKNMSWCILVFALVISFQYSRADLPDHSRPLHYDLELSLPKTKDDDFEGRVNITLKILKPTKVLTLHSRHLILKKNKTLLVSGAEEFRPTEQHYTPDLLKLIFLEELHLGIYSLHLEYSSHTQNKFAWFPRQEKFFSSTESSLSNEDEVKYVFSNIKTINLPESRCGSRSAENHWLRVGGGSVIGQRQPATTGCRRYSWEVVGSYNAAQSQTLSPTSGSHQNESLSDSHSDSPSASHTLHNQHYNLSILSHDYRYLLIGNSGNSQRKARDYFPCWDGPEFKSTFNISMKHAPDSIVFSYMPVHKTNNGTNVDGRKLTYFETTPNITASKITFLSSNYLSLTRSEKLLKLWSPEHVSNYTNLGFESILKAFSIMKRFKNISSPYPETDIIVVPCVRSSSSYVDNNWRPFIFCQNEFLSTHESTAIDNMMIIQKTTDLVTSRLLPDMLSPHWFNDSWGMKGLQRSVSCTIAVAVMRDSEMGYFFVLQDKMGSFKLSQYYGKNPEKDKLHDEQKAASMMYMLGAMVPPKIFETVLYKMHIGEDKNQIIEGGFWKLLEKALNEANSTRVQFDLKKMMNAYATQTGYPILDVTRNYTSGTIKVTHEIVFTDKDKYPNNGSLQYRIPINFATNSTLNFSSTLPTYWMDPNEELIIEGIDRDDWFIFNIQDTAYYCVNYDEENWHRIADFLNPDRYSEIHFKNRAALLGDALMLYETKRLGKNILLELIAYLPREENRVPWLTGLEAITDMLTFPQPDEIKIPARKLLHFFLRQSTLNHESDTDRSFLEKFMYEVAVASL